MTPKFDLEISKTIIVSVDRFAHQKEIQNPKNPKMSAILTKISNSERLKPEVLRNDKSTDGADIQK